MRSRGVVCVVAVMLAVTIGAGTAFAQAPVVPATTTAPAQPDDQSKVDPTDGEETPKAETPKAETPKAETPKAEKSGKPGDDQAKPEKPKPTPPTPEPKTPKQAQPKPVKPKPTPQPKPAQPKSAQAVAPSAEPNEPGPQAAAATSVSPRPKAAPRVAASRIRHGTTRGRPAPKESRKGARRPAGAISPAWSGTQPAGSARDAAGAASADATATSHSVAAAAQILTPRVAPDGAAAASASLERQQPRVLILDARQPGNAALLLAIVLTAGVAFLLGRGVRRQPAAGYQRPRQVPRPTRLNDEWQLRHRRDLTSPRLYARRLRVPRSRPRRSSRS
jgi:hypothetical protein